MISQKTRWFWVFSDEGRKWPFTDRENIHSTQSWVRSKSRGGVTFFLRRYSVSDLLDVPNGSLVQQLQKVVEFAKDHVLNCSLCSQKGFICEVCDDPRVIYPFFMESTYQVNF